MKQKPRERQLILIVDDDREIVRGLSVRLRSAGYEIERAYDGEDGLATAVKMQPDAIVLDIRMPGMDGLMMLKKLREHRSICKVPVIVLSANVADQARVKAFELQASYFMQKPYQPDKLLLAVASMLKNRAPDDYVPADASLSPVA